MHDAIFRVPTPVNEPVQSYLPNSPEKLALDKAIKIAEAETIEIPCIIGGKRVKTGRTMDVINPCDKSQVLARFHCAGEAEVKAAITAAKDAKQAWQDTPWEARAAIFLRCAELLAGPWRMKLNAATMLSMGKTCQQAEIDSACEFIDFLRFNASFAQELYAQQPLSVPGMWNSSEMRPLEGYVLAITPFNFSAIAGNLCSAPAMMGNTVLWKPAESQTLAAYRIFELFEEAGVPAGVINFLPGLGHEVAPIAMADRDFGGLNFTGSTTVFKSLWKAAAENLDTYKSYPRLVGETGGKDFLVAHKSADDAGLITALIRGAYEYQGQKCSALSRAYVAESTWTRIKSELIKKIDGLEMGDVRDHKNFMGAVIKQTAFDKHKKAIDEAQAGSETTILAGGECDDSKGFFVRPTLIQTTDPRSRTMCEELFGPILTLYVYPDEEWSEILATVDTTSDYGLTGAVFANDRAAILEAKRTLCHAAGNFYINDKPTAAVVGQQPFGGARGSGTNDKAGAPQNLLRWTSARTIKETLSPATEHRHPYQG